MEAGQLLAEIHHVQQRWKEIVNVLEPLLKYRHDYSIYHMLGEATYNLDDFSKAAKYYKEAVRLNGDSALDHYQLGNIHLAKNRYARAVTSYESALRLGFEESCVALQAGVELLQPPKLFRQGRSDHSLGRNARNDQRTLLFDRTCAR